MCRTRVLRWSLSSCHTSLFLRLFFFFNDTATTEIYTLSLHDALPITAISRHFDTVSLCLSKGLGAPVGSVLCGKRELITRARRWRKVVGGGMRQAGILAAAGIIALKQHVERLAEDHANAQRLADGLAGIPALGVDPSSVQTNMVFCAVADADMRPLQLHLKANGILIGSGNPLRLVTHLDISASDVDKIIAAFADYFADDALVLRG